jgi:hypothetical protein
MSEVKRWGFTTNDYGPGDFEEMVDGEYVEIEEYSKLAHHAEVMANTLQNISAFAVGNGDVCEIIAKRCRAAYSAYDKDFPAEEQV